MTERFAAVCVLGKVGGILAVDEPDVPNSGVKADSCLAKDIWPENTPNDHLSVQSRAIFDSVVIGQLRLRRDLVEHLAVRWIRRVYSGQAQSWRIHREMLVSVGTRTIALNSRASLAILLSIEDESLFDQLLLHAPLRFVLDTAVHAFSEAQRIRMLSACAKYLATGADLRGLDWGADSDILRAFVFPAALVRLQNLWQQLADSCVNLRVFLLWILREAQNHGCAEIALDASTRFDWGERTNLLGVQALATSKLASAKTSFVKHLLADTRKKKFTLKVAHQAIEYLFPEFISNDDFVKLAIRWDTDGGDRPYALHSYAAAWAERVRLDVGRAALLQACVDHVTKNVHCDHPEYELPVPSNKVLFAFASVLAKRWLSEPETDGDRDILIESCVQLLSLDASHSSAEEAHKEIVQLLNKRLCDKHRVYWGQIALARSRRAMVGKTTDSPYEVWTINRFSWSQDDVPFFYDKIATSTHSDDRKIALAFLYDLQAERGASADGTERLRAALSNNHELIAKLEEWLEPKPVDPAISSLRRQQAEYEAKEKQRHDANREAWLQLQQRLLTHVGSLTDKDLRSLWKWLSMRSQKRSHSVDALHGVSQLPTLAHVFGAQIAKSFESGLREYWRKHLVVQAKIEGNGMWSSDRNRMASLGLELEFGGNTPIVASTLTEQQIERGLEWAISEGSLPNWIDNLAPYFGTLIRAKLGGQLIARLSDQNEHFQPIRDLQYRLPRLRELLAPDILQWLRNNRRRPDAVLDAVLDVLVGATSIDRLALADLLAARAREATDAQMTYLRYLMRTDASRAVICLTSHECSSIDVVGFLTEVFADRGRARELGFLPGVSLDEKRSVYVELVQISLAAIDPKSDEDHTDEGPHTPSSRDNAQEARNHLLAKLGAIPGGPTITSLQTIHAQPEAEPLREWIARMIEQRITEDAEPIPLSAEQLIETEKHCEMTPVTGKQLLQLVMDRLADIQHELHHGAFSNINLLRR